MSEIKAILSYRRVIPVLVIYILVTALGLHFHEFGLEEGQQLLFARDSVSFSDLYHNMRYEGHPRLWCFLLYLILHYISASYVSIQVIHLLITTTTIYLFLRYAPFSLLMKIGMIFSYYFIFEYNLQVRSYALGILFLFITCLLLNKPEKNLVVIGCLLWLLCNTDLFYAFAAVGVYLYLLMDSAAQKRLFTPAFYGLTGLFLAGIACSLIQAQIPRADYILHTSPGEWLSRKNLSAGLLAVPAGWLPVPQDRAHFWNTFWVGGHGIAIPARVILFLLLLLFPGAVLREDRKALVFYYTSLFLLLALMVVTTLSAARYFGMVFIYFLAACWMAGGGRIGGGVGSVRGPVWLRVSFGLIVAVQLAVGLYALEQDITRPFSQSKNAVAYVKEHGLDDQPVVVNGYIAGPALCVYLGKKVWYLNTGGEGSFCYWRKPYMPSPPRPIGEEMAGSPALQKLDSFLLLSNKEIDRQTIQEGIGDFQLNPLTDFRNGILSTEDCYIYQATQKQTIKK